MSGKTQVSSRNVFLIDQSKENESITNPVALTLNKMSHPKIAMATQSLITKIN
jgi:hypothetical protein